MKLSQMKKEELELYSYTDLAQMIIKESKKPLNTMTIFKKICDLLDLSEEEYADKVSDFYTSLTTDKDFVMLDSGEWDLRDHHPSQTIIDDDDMDDEVEEEIEEEAEEEVEESLDDVDDDDDDIDDEELTIISEEELEED